MQLDSYLIGGDATLMAALQAETEQYQIKRVRLHRDANATYFFPSTAARHLPYSSSRCAAYSSGFAAEPVP